MYNALEICNCLISASSATLLEEIALYKEIGDVQDVNKSIKTVFLYSLLVVACFSSSLINIIITEEKIKRKMSTT